MQGFLASIIPNVFLVILWAVVRTKNLPEKVLIIGWISMFLFLIILGAIFGGGAECTRFASSVIYVSSVVLSGPILIWSVDKKINQFWVAFITILIAYPSTIIAIIFLTMFGQIWI